MTPLASAGLTSFECWRVLLKSRVGESTFIYKIALRKTDRMVLLLAYILNPVTFNGLFSKFLLFFLNFKKITHFCTIKSIRYLFVI